MPVEVVLPRVDMAMDKGSILAWKVKEGETVRAGDLLFEMNTDKATMEVEAPASGTIDAISIPEGVEVPVGTVVALIFKAGEERASPSKPESPSIVEARSQNTRATLVAHEDGDSALPSAATFDETSQAASPIGRLRLTPLARRLARQNEIDPGSLQGSGPKGRIDARDIIAAVQVSQGGQPSAPSALRRRVDAENAPDDSTFEIRTASSEAAGLFYREWIPAAAGTNAALLLHGFGGNSLSFDAIARALARSGTHVIAPDLPGHGRSVVETSSLAATVEALQAFLERTITGSVAMIGHSFGAVCATRLARQPESNIDRLVLLAPAGIGLSIDGSFITGMAEAATADAVAHLLRRLTLRSADHSQAQLEAIAADLGRGRLGALGKDIVRGSTQSIDIIADLERLSVPAHVLVGRDDAIIPWTQVENLPASAAVHIVRAAGHMIHWDQPRIVADLLRVILRAR